MPAEVVRRRSAAGYAKIFSLALLASSIAFLLLSVYLAFLDRYVPSLLSLTSGILLLSSALGVFRELSERVHD